MTQFPKISIVLVLAACATKAPYQLTDEQLCVAYGDAVRSNNAAALRSEVEARHLLRKADDEALITQKRIRIGISKCAMFAAWGHSTRDNRTVFAGGERVQHVYRALAGTARRATYVYTENGRVTGWQD